MTPDTHTPTPWDSGNSPQQEPDPQQDLEQNLPQNPPREHQPQGSDAAPADAEPPEMGPVGPRYNMYAHYQPQPIRRPHGSSALAAVSLILGVFSFFFLTVGLSFFFGSLGILLALLSRGSGPLSGQAKLGIGICSAGILGGAAAIVMVFSSIFGSVQSGDFIQQLNEYYEYYMNGGDLDPLEEDAPDLDLDYDFPEGNIL